MAGKYALYLPYHIITSLEDEGFSDAQIGSFVRGVVKYHQKGTVPKFEDRSLSLLFSSSKPEFDNNIARYEKKMQAQSDNGKKGGAPKGNLNAAGNRGGGAPRGNRNAAKKEYPEHENKHKQRLEFEPEKQTQAKQAESESELESDIDTESSSSTSVLGGREVVFSKQPTTTTTTIDLFINSCKEAGYSLDKQTAGKILDVGLDPAWLEGPQNFLEYIAEVVQKNYHDKPLEEKRRLFRKILAAEDRKNDYPEWRKKKIADVAAQAERHRKEAAAGEKQRQIEEARENPPKICSHCGKPIAIEGRRGDCPSCKYDYFFNDETGKWEWSEPIDLKSIFAKLAKPAEAQK